MQLQKTVGRNQIVTLTKDDFLTLKPSSYVNDNVIDFWMVWLTRNVLDADSSIIIFTSHFYSSLINDKLGVEHVSGWMNFKSIDIFSKNILLFPICLDNHWSLIASLHPGRVSNDVHTLDNTSGGMMIHLDSLNFHNGFQICQNLPCFFNFQLSKKRGSSMGNIFTSTTYPLLSPAGM
jgi:Ulp1 family protease